MEKAVVVFFAALTAFVVFPSVTAKADLLRLQRIKPWDITVTNNSYNVLVGISDDIFPSQGPRLIENMKRMMKSASAKLSKMTRNRTGFNEVTIVVPNTWSSYSRYSDGETVSNANFYISASSFNRPTLQYYLGDTTKSYRAVLLSKTYVESNPRDAGEVIVEKWFALHFGIKKTYNQLRDDLLSTNWCNSTNRREICEKFQGELNWNETRSTSEPSFKIVRQRSKRVIMIVDVSGSMDTMDRLNKSKEGLKVFIDLERDRPGTSLGLVKFSTTAKTLSNLRNDTKGKNGLKNTVVNLSPGGRTSIGAGLKEALKILNSHSEKTNRAEFILISDGEETDGPLINQAAPDVISSNVTVHTIAITDSADSRLDALGAATGGLSFRQKDSDQINDLAVAFKSIHGYDISDPASSGIVIFSKRKTTTNPSFTFLIDESIGRMTTLVFECPIRSCDMTFTIHAPRRRNFIAYRFYFHSENRTRAEYEIVSFSRAGQVKVKIADAKAGRWYVRTISRNSVLGLTVTSYPKDIRNYPILASAFWGKDQIYDDKCAVSLTMYTLISKDNNPVIGAVVRAMIESSEEISGPHVLYDDGIGRDIKKDDGIYTGNFPEDAIKHITKNVSTERFMLKVTINGNRATLVQKRQLVGAAPDNEDQRWPGPDTEPVDRLERFELGGSTMLDKKEPDACKVCNTDMVLIFHSSSKEELPKFKKFLYDIILSLIENKKNARMKIGIVSAEFPDSAIVGLSVDVVSVSNAFTLWNPNGDGNDQPNFATGLRTAARLFNNDTRRKVILLITDTDTGNISETEAAKLEAGRLRSRDIALIPVGVKGIPSFLRKIAQDPNDIMEVATFLQLPSISIRVINKACGFSLVPEQP